MEVKRIGLQSQIVNTYSKTDKSMGDIWGDEIMCWGLKRAFQDAGVEFAGVYDKFNQPPGDLDVLINLYPPDVGLIANAKCNILWFQVPSNYYDWQARAAELKEIFKIFLFASRKLLVNAVENKFEGCFLFPMSADHKVYKKIDMKKDKNIVFVGNNNGNRNAKKIDDILVSAKDFGLEIYGSFWDQHPILKDCWKGKIHPFDVPELYNRSKIILSIHPDGHFDNDMPTSRVFEALACGSFIISDSVPLLREAFPDMIFITDDAKKAYDFYLGLDDLRQDIANKTHETFIKSWTWDYWANILLTYLKQMEL